MLKVGSTIIYASAVCKVKAVEKKEIGKAVREYYVLTPIYDDKNTFFVPVDNPKLLEKMREILSAEEIFELIKKLPESELLWLDDDRERAALYREVQERGERTEIMRMIKTLYEKREELSAKGKKLHAADESAFKRAEKTIYDEFALVLDIKREDVVPLILKLTEISPNK